MNTISLPGSGITSLPGRDIITLPGRQPSEEAPNFGGECYKTDKLRLDFHPPFTPPFNNEVYFVSPTDIITFPVGYPTHITRALNSDVTKAETSLLATVGFIQEGSQIYSRVDDKQEKHYGRLLALNFPPGFRAKIEEELTVTKESLRTECNLPIQPNVSVLTQTIQRFMTNGHQGGKLVAESLMTLAIVQTLKVLDKKVKKKTNTAPLLNPVTLSNTLDYIEEYLDKNIGLEEIAKEAAISIFHFSRCFKSAVGKSPYAYLIDRRIERTKNLLINTNRPLSDIALACGFSSQSHLSTLFKRITGITPSRYRAESQR